LSLLVTKLHPPPRHEQTVARDGLVERLRAAPGIKLTVVAAPAGSGKTTLLGAWREEEEARQPVAWLTLDEGDNDPVVLWSYVLAALRGAVPTLKIPTSPERAGAARVVDLVLPDLINKLAVAGEVALVLDDFHRLSSGPARNSIAWLIEHAPSTFRLVLATRSEPGLPLAALRAHAALLELRAADLAFTRAEAANLLNDRLALGLGPGSVDSLVERTEGWPAGLYLAALSLQGVDDRDGFVARFGGESRHVVDFLVDEVLEAYDPETQALMLRSSILERFCGPLCDAVLEQEGSDRLLAGLARTNLFLMPLDDRGQWYRFHHLFAQLLRVELAHREPGLAPTLHRRALAWYRDNSSVDEAIEHALAAGEFAEAAEMLAREWSSYADVSRFTTIIGWLGRLPQELLRTDPSLLLVSAWMHSMSGERDAAAETMAAVEQLVPLDTGPLPDGFSSVESSLVTLRALSSWGDTGAGLASARRAAELEGPDSRWRPVVYCALGAALYFQGRFEEAERQLQEAAELAPLRQQWWIATSAIAYRSYATGELGWVDTQVALAEQAVQLARERDGWGVDGEAFVALGSALAARGEFDDALPLLEQGAAILRSRGRPHPLANALIFQGKLLRAMGRGEDAAAVLREARLAIEPSRDPGILAERLSALEWSAPRNGHRGDGALSERELAILRMLKGPLSERDIGRELYLSHNTIHTHTRSIYRKLGVSSRSQALESARKLGLI
jgi:LuxR family transcriptional regulator, maltose regulon positive regulatory protein